jgi:HEPN domain-containing protein
MLKAIWIERLGETHPRTHNLAYLALQLSLEISEEQLTLLQDLAEQYLPSHYADVDAEYPEEVSSEYVVQTAEVFQWLRQLLS